MKKRIQVLQDCRRAGLTRLFSINTYLRLKRKREERQRSKTVLDEVLGQIKVSILCYNLHNFGKFLILLVYFIFNVNLYNFFMHFMLLSKVLVNINGFTDSGVNSAYRSSNSYHNLLWEKVEHSHMF